MKKAAKKKPSSAGRKRRPRKRVPSRFPRRWTIRLSLLLLIILAVSFWLWGDHLGLHKATPAFEEESRNGLTVLGDEVEFTIYRSLRQLGLQASQVKFRKVVHRTQRKRQWDYSELEVMLAPDRSLAHIEKLLSKNLGALAGELSWEAFNKTDSTLEFLIRVEGIVTHRLAFTLTPEQLPLKADQPPKVKLAIVIDDLGHDDRLARKFIEIDGLLSFSVLPNATFSERIARSIHETGQELLLHLPMEPKGYPEVDPGSGALLMNMTDEQLGQALGKALESFPHIDGVNNHMGSRFCEYDNKMRVVMRELKKRDLFFLDSRTTKKTKAYSVAVQLGVPAAERDIFLDNVQSPQAVRNQFKRLIQRARLKGTAIGIAHPHEVTLLVLRQVIPRLAEQGVEVVPVSQILHYQ